MATVAELLAGQAARIAPLAGESSGAEEPRRDAEILLSHVLQKPRAWLYTWPEKTVSEADQHRFAALVQRRVEGEPIAYLLGTREFWSLELVVNEHTLIPRHETETLVTWALELPLPSSARVLDLGTGSGAIALALSSEREHWQVQGVDVSPEALEIARQNAARCELSAVTFSCSDWFAQLTGQRFDLLVANPPYIDAEDAHLALGDVRFEPRSALVAADQGLADLSAIIAAAPEYLQAGGWLLLEHGFEQGDAVRERLRDAGFGDVSTRRDLSGQERISGGCWHAQ